MSDVEKMYTFIVLYAVTSAIGTSASTITLLLIYRMKITGHTLLLATMTWYQLLYDVTFFFSNVSLGYWWVTSANVCQIIGGVGSGIISTFVAYVAFHVIYFRQSLDVKKKYHYMLVASIVPSIANAVVYLVASIPENAHKRLAEIATLDMYYNIRLLTILVNFFLCGSAIYLVRRMASQSGSEKTPSERAITTLVRRMIYYPIVQAVSRSGYAWYQEAYGTQIDASHADDKQFAALIFIGVVTPSLSLGYLMIFLRMQPHAFAEFTKMFRIGWLYDGSSSSRRSKGSMSSRSSTVNGDIGDDPDGNDIRRRLLSDAEVESAHHGENATGAAGALSEQLLFLSVLSSMRHTISQVLFGRQSDFDRRDDDDLIDATAAPPVSATAAATATTAEVAATAGDSGDVHRMEQYPASGGLGGNNTATAYKQQQKHEQQHQPHRTTGANHQQLLVTAVQNSHNSVESNQHRQHTAAVHFSNIHNDNTVIVQDGSTAGFEGEENQVSFSVASSSFRSTLDSRFALPQRYGGDGGQSSDDLVNMHSSDEILGTDDGSTSTTERLH